jgi:hypothetical protein
MFTSLRRLTPLICFSLVALFADGQIPTSPASLETSSSAAVRLQRLPLAFEQNVGQAAIGTDYLIHSGILLAELNATRIRLSLPSSNGYEQQVSIHLDAARQDAKPIATENLGGESNYLLGENASAWHTHVQRYGRVTYPEVYNGIDLTYYGNGSQVEHDFIVHPGASPSSIRLRFDGTGKVRVTHAGDLQITLANSAMTLRQPRAYQMIDGERHKVKAKFILANGGASFQLGSYDRTQTLVIDPVLDYSTFLGDASVYVTGVAVDATGNTYITGEAPAAFPANAGSTACSSCVTATNKLAVYVTKLNAAGTAVIYSTFIGGSVNPYNSVSNDQSVALTVDTNNNAIVTGWTSSTDFPLKNPISSGVASFQDGFLVSLASDGSSLNFSSRLGGSSSGSSSALVYPESITTDSAGNVYVAGLSESPYLPVTPGALHGFSPSYGHTGAFLLKFAPNGALGYGAIVGEVGSASGSTGPTGLAVDENGVVYMAGTAGSTVFSSPATTPWPTTSGAYQTTLISPSENAPFVTRISADGSAILSSTLMGAGSVRSMTLTPTHDVLIAGIANYNFPITSDAYNKNISTSINGTTTLGALGFFAKVSEDGTQLLYSSMFGPNGSSIYINGIGQDPSGNVWLAGTSNSPIATLVHPLQSTFSYQFSGTGFIAKFDPAMHNLLFSSYVNSTSGFSQVNGLALDSNGLAHVVGIASQDFPTTQGAAIRTVTAPPPDYSYNYGFAALIDGSKPGPSICFANASSSSAQLGTTSQGSFDIVNCGDGPLTISAIQLTSDVFALANPNVCTGTLGAGSSCTLAYAFTPKVAGNASATVLITSDAPMAANSRALSGFGTVPIVFLPGGTKVNFDPAILGTAPQTGIIFIGNKGTAPLVVDTTRTAITGPFTIINTSCSQGPVKVSVGNTNYACTYTFTFNPTAIGASTGTLTLYTNDPASPSITFALSGSTLASYPTPTLTRLTIPTISLDSGPVDRSIVGTNFFPTTTVMVNGINVPVKSQTNTSITFTVDPSILGAMGEFPVQVSNPAPGGSSNMLKLTTYRLLNLTSTNVVYEPNSKLLYVAIPATSSSNPNTILPIDPATGSYGPPISVGKNPTRLALSDDGHYLYVGFYYTYSSTGQMQRIDLKTGLVDRTFTLPNSSDGILDMHVVPGSPQLLVASLARSGSPSENGVALFNDSGVVQYIANDYPSNYTLDSFAFTSDRTYYGYPFGSTFFGSASVSDSGIAPITRGGFSCCDQASGSIVVSDGASLYTNSGQIWDPKAQKLLGRYDNSLFYEAGIAADATAKRTFILKSTYQPDNGFSYPAVLSYDPSTIKLADVIYFSLPSSPLSLTRWGSDGFAFLSGPFTAADFTNPYSESQLVLFRSSIATPGATGIATVTALSPVTVPAGSPTLTLTINGSGFGVGSTVFWNGAARQTTFVSASRLTALIPATDLATPGAAQVSVSNSGNVSSGLPFIVGSPGFTLSSSSLAFGKIPIGITAQQTLTLQNSGNLSLSNISITVSGQNAADFTTTTTCGTNVSVNSTCGITITFKPTGLGDENATVTVGSMGTTLQTVSIAGTGAAPDFILPTPMGSSTANIPAGQPASFNFTVSPYGAFTGTVTMSCTNLPVNATCTFTPASFTLGSTSVPVSVSISTQQTIRASLQSPHEGPSWPSHLSELAILLALPIASGRMRRWLGKAQPLLWLLVVCAGTLLLNGCGGSNTSPNSPVETVQKTPVGTYTVTVVATSGAVSHSTNLTLVVQ